MSVQYRLTYRYVADGEAPREVTTYCDFKVMRSAKIWAQRVAEALRVYATFSAYNDAWRRWEELATFHPDGYVTTRLDKKTYKVTDLL